MNVLRGNTRNATRILVRISRSHVQSTVGQTSHWLANATESPPHSQYNFSSCPPLGAKPLPPRPKIDENDLVENFVKGSGPGGQKINKTNSAVQLHHKPTGMVIKCQETRSRSQNRKLARKLLSEKLEEMELGPESRVQIKAEQERKRKAIKAKKSKRKYRTVDGKEVEDDEDTPESRMEKMENDGGTTELDTRVINAQLSEEDVPEWEKRGQIGGIKSDK